MDNRMPISHLAKKVQQHIDEEQRDTPNADSIPQDDCPTALLNRPGRIAQSVGHLTRKSEVLGSIPGLATYFCFSFHFFKKGSCQLLAKVCARSTG